MGMPGTWELLIILVVVILIFGTKKLRNIGGDLGGAIKNFRRSMRDGEEEEEKKATETTATASPQVTQSDSGKVIEGQITAKESSQRVTN
jgi:sec-independent protein translocase protein TatA